MVRFTTFSTRFFLLLAMLLPVAGRAASLPEQGVVEKVTDGDTLRLQSGEKIRLLGIQAPEIGHDAMPEQPFAKAAKDALTELTLGQTLRLEYGEKPRDRHGRLLAHLYLPDGRWVQQLMLEHGMAMVYSFPDNRTYVRELLAFEQNARIAKRGLWAEHWYAPLPHTEAVERLNRFALIFGQVRNVATTKSGAYLNFGEDWKTDFTLHIPKKHLPVFDKQWLQTLQGKTVLAHGWVHYQNGPAMTLSHPEQIEELDE